MIQVLPSRSPLPLRAPDAGLPPLLGRSTDEMVEYLRALGEKPYRGRQVAEWLYRKGALDFSVMTDLPAPLRERLAQEATVGRGEIVVETRSADGTVKLLLRFSDGEAVETVYLPYEDRLSVCISTQAGCPAACAFCATGTLGLRRNLTAGEILQQLMLAGDLARRHGVRAEPQPIDNVVLMGMGEPLLNYTNTVKAVRLMNRELGLSVRKVTLSTVGITPAIQRLSQEGLPLTLAVSLHAPSQELRERIVPMARKYQLDSLIAACQSYFAETGRRVTYEYVLLAGVNDQTVHAQQLGKLLRDQKTHVNLIPYNPGPGFGTFEAPSALAVLRFQGVLEAAGIRVTQRVTRGQDIAAACGQLHRTASESGVPGRAIVPLPRTTSPA